MALQYHYDGPIFFEVDSYEAVENEAHASAYKADLEAARGVLLGARDELLRKGIDPVRNAVDGGLLDLMKRIEDQSGRREINDDIQAYAKRWSNRIFVVYDTSGIRDTAAFKRDLGSGNNSILVVKH